MVQIAVEILLQAKVLLASNRCFMARKLYRTCKWKKAIKANNLKLNGNLDMSLVAILDTV